jgi:hypothetical protein
VEVLGWGTCLAAAVDLPGERREAHQINTCSWPLLDSDGSPMITMHSRVDFKSKDGEENRISLRFPML